MNSNVTVAIIGSGFGGIISAIQLKQAGIRDIVILERREFVGGTWAQNTYPGAAVDVQSPLYSISFEPYDWSRMFAEQDEIRTYTNHVIDKHQLRELIKTEHSVKKIEWDAKNARWNLDIENGSKISAQFVISATGPLSTPVVPDFPGKADFKGPNFHTNLWDHSVDYKGKKVAIIGSGSSAAQVIPAIAPDVDTLHIFQRTPHWVIPRLDFTFKPWFRALMRRNWFYQFVRKSIYWWLEGRVLGLKYSKAFTESTYQQAAKWHIKRTIDDPKLQEQLTPDFTLGCKRVVISSALYPALNRSNVIMHDKHDGVEKITESGIVSAKGQTHDVDIIVYATGFDAADGVISFEVIGKEGKTLNEHWSEYPKTFVGSTTAGFPNLFLIQGPNTGTGHTSAIFMIESQIRYILSAIQKVRGAGLNSIEITQEAEDSYNQQLDKGLEGTVWQTGGCQSWYQSKKGKVSAIFPGFSFTFRRFTKEANIKDHKIS